MPASSQDRLFHVGDVISVLNDRMVAPGGLDAHHRILSYLTSDPALANVALGRARQESVDFLREQFPALAAVEVPQIESIQGCFSWLDGVVDAHGPVVPVPRMPAVDHTVIDLMDEVRMRFPDGKGPQEVSTRDLLGGGRMASATRRASSVSVYERIVDACRESRDQTLRALEGGELTTLEAQELISGPARRALWYVGCLVASPDEVSPVGGQRSKGGERLSERQRAAFKEHGSAMAFHAVEKSVGAASLIANGSVVPEEIAAALGVVRAALVEASAYLDLSRAPFRDPGIA